MTILMSHDNQLLWGLAWFGGLSTSRVAFCTHDFPAVQPNQRTSGPADQRISASADQRTRSADQRTRSADQQWQSPRGIRQDQRISGSSGPAYQRISGSADPADQRTGGSADQRTRGSSGPADQRISGPGDPADQRIQRTSGSANQISGSAMAVTPRNPAGSADQRIQRTSGPADQRISGSSGPADQRTSEPAQGSDNPTIISSVLGVFSSLFSSSFQRVGCKKATGFFESLEYPISQLPRVILKNATCSNDSSLHQSSWAFNGPWQRVWPMIDTSFCYQGTPWVMELRIRCSGTLWGLSALLPFVKSLECSRLSATHGAVFDLWFIAIDLWNSSSNVHTYSNILYKEHFGW